MVENNCLRRTLCHGTLQVSGIHQNKSRFIFHITTRPKLLVNDCVKINKGTAIDHSYFPFYAAGIPLLSHFKTLQC